MDSEQTYTAFKGQTMIASGSLENVLPELKKRFDADKSVMILVFDDATGRQVDFDLRGTEQQCDKILHLASLSNQHVA